MTVEESSVESVLKQWRKDYESYNEADMLDAFPLLLDLAEVALELSEHYEIRPIGPIGRLDAVLKAIAQAGGE